MKMYLKLNIDRRLKFIMTGFRLGISDIDYIITDIKAY